MAINFKLDRKLAPRIIELREQGLTDYQIADRLKTAAARVRRVINASGRPELRMMSLKLQHAMRAFEMERQGRTYDEIAEACGISRQTAWHAAWLGREFYERRHGPIIWCKS